MSALAERGSLAGLADDVRDVIGALTATQHEWKRLTLSNVLERIDAHRCRTPAPEIVSGAEAAKLPVDEARRLYAGFQADDLPVRGQRSTDLSTVLAYILCRAPEPRAPLAVGDEVKTEAQLVERAVVGTIVEGPAGRTRKIGGPVPVGAVGWPVVVRYVPEASS